MNANQHESDGATRVAYILGVPLAENVVRQWPQMGEIVRSPYTLVGQSDAGAHVQYLSNFGVCTTLLGEYVRERRLLSL